MRITKDEARILAAALEEAKFDLAAVESRSREESRYAIEALETLELKLEAVGKDERRTGRKSRDKFSDVLTRFIKGRR